ncbi:MAG: WXG100 family type VII secretion target [Kineosporiaceae bacterium]
MDEFEVDVARVGATAAAASACAGRIEAEVGAMTGHLAELERGWQGSAATAFGQVAERWRATQHRVVADLRTVAAVLAATGRRYADAEDEAVRRMRQ